MQLGVIPAVGLLKGLFNSASDALKSAEPQSYPTVETKADPAAASEALSAIAAQYDVAQLTPRDLARMIEELRTSGVVPAEDLQALDQLRASFDRAGFDPDEPLDVLDLLRDAVDAERAATPHTAAAPSPAERQLAWMERLDLVRRGGDLAELDAVA